MDIHECKEKFLTRKIDDCSGEGYNRCFGNDPMILECWYEDKDGCESYFDNFIEVIVKFCPYCGLKSSTK